MCNKLNLNKSMKKFIIWTSDLLYVPKINLTMKLTSILLLIALFQIQASNTYSQDTKVTLACNDMEIRDVLNEVELKTPFKFLYEDIILKDNRKISITANKEKLSSVLDQIFKNQKIEYKVVNKQIILIPKNKAWSILRFKPEVKKIEKLPFPKKITGTVTDENGEPLIGVTVKIKGINRGVVSDLEGKYRITVVSAEDVIVFTYLGFKTQEIVAKKQEVINVKLETSQISMDELVLVGYGSVKKEAYTGSVGVVNVESIAKQGTILNVDQALQGQVAGVQVSSPSGKPGAAARVRVRGSSSILGTNNPLYVVDGVPISPSIETPGYTDFIDDLSNNEATGLANEGYTNDLGFIDFNNIESISVLKDATATAIYGSRAAGGVVIITTKDGGKSRKPQFDLSVTQRYNFAEKIDVLNTSQYEEIYKEAIENYVNSGAVLLSSDTFAQGILDGTEVDSTVDTDWQALVGNSTSKTTNYAFSVRGGSEKGSYYSSLSLQNDKGAIIGDELKRYAFGLNLREEIKENLTFFSNLSLGRTESDLALGSIYSALEASTAIRPDKTPYDEDGDLVAKIGDIYNPLSLKDRRISTTNFSMLSSIGLQFEPIKDLMIKTTGILQYIDNESYAFYPSYSQSGLTTNGKGNQISSKTFNPTIETTVTYDLSLGNSNANILVGNTLQNERSETNSYYGENFPNDDTLTGLSYAGEDISIQQSITESTLVSFFSRIVYDYDKKYLLSFAGRVDGSSKFGENNRWASFPSGGIGWNIHREKFAENWSALNFLKLRASIGQSGNVTFDPNQSFSLFGSLNGTLGVYNGDTGIVPVRIGNPDLKWEITTQKDFGIEFAFFKNRVKGELGYYKKETKDVLYQTDLGSSSGLYNVIGNIGDTENNGIEVNFNFNLIDKKDWKWNLGFNAATAKSKVVRLNTSYKDEGGGVSLNGYYFEEGKSIGLIRGYVANGLFQSQDEIDALDAAAPDGVYQGAYTSPGDIYYKDLDGDGEISTSDQTAIGSVEPDFFGGINTNINYKGLSLNIFANYSLGNDIYWKAGENTYSYSSINEQGNKLALALNRWTPENTNAKYPRAVYRTNYSGGNSNNRASSLYMEKGDYLRIKTVTLGYNLPKEVLKNISFKSMYFYVTATNLFTFTKYPGGDPEYTNISSFRATSDTNKYPVTKQVTAGVRLTF